MKYYRLLDLSQAFYIQASSDEDNSFIREIKDELSQFCKKLIDNIFFSQKYINEESIKIYSNNELWKEFSDVIYYMVFEILKKSWNECLKSSKELYANRASFPENLKFKVEFVQERASSLEVLEENDSILKKIAVIINHLMKIKNLINTMNEFSSSNQSSPIIETNLNKLNQIFDKLNHLELFVINELDQKIDWRPEETIPEDYYAI